VLRKLSEQVLGEEQYDVPLPAGYLDDPRRLAEGLTQRLSGFTDALGRIDPDEVADHRATTFLTERTPVLRGGLTDLVGLDRIGDATLLQRRTTAACVLKTEGDRLVVLLGDRELRMPLRLSEPMEFIRDTPSFRLADLSGWLDEESRTVVARRLVREGLLRIAPDLSAE
jgi:hypothetical protein